MSSYLLDTGIFLGYLRGAAYAEYTERKYAVSQPPNVALISVVSKGELYSLAIQRGWGTQRRQALDDLLRQIPSVNINTEQIIQRYAEIDAYSQGKNPNRSLPIGLTSRNMGKNDLWIAATSSVLNATLLTDRFHGTYPPNFNEGTHLISRKGPTRFQVVPFAF